MSPTDSDIIAINQVLALWGHILDQRKWDRLHEVLADDAVYDCSIFGFGKAQGLEAIRVLLSKDGHALAHHSSNVVVEDGPGETLAVLSKGMGIMQGGVVSSVTYYDTFRRSPSGWRIAERALGIDANTLKSK